MKAAEIRSIKALLNKMIDLGQASEIAGRDAGDAVFADRLRGLTKQFHDELFYLDRRLADAQRLEGGTGK